MEFTIGRPDAVRAWAARWSLVREACRREARATTPAERLRQLELLHDAARDFGWRTDAPAAVAAVRARWARLRAALRG